MKKVYATKRRLNYKDFLGWIFKIFVHQIAFFIYIALILLFRMFLYQQSDFLNILEWQKLFILYSITLVSFVNGILHISYYETGSFTLRITTWIFSLIYMLSTPILLLIY